MQVRVIDDFAAPGLIAASRAVWPSESWPHWHVYDDTSSRKMASKDACRLPRACQMLIEKMAQVDIGEMLGIHDQELFPDLDLHGAGMHWIRQGGFLSRHLDSSHHPSTGWHREANGILFVSECQGGQLVVQDTIVDPKPGRAVFFATNNESWHFVHPVSSGERCTLSLFWWSQREAKRERMRALFRNV